MTLRRRILGNLCASGLLLLTSACGKDSEPESKCEPLYGGSATDEAWMTMVDALKKGADTSKAVTVTWPAEEEVHPLDSPPPRISWTSPLRASLERDTPSRLAQALPRPSRGPLAWLAELLVPTAEAHLPPYTGDIYWVKVSVPGRECPVQVLTSELSWQVDDASWGIMSEPGPKGLSLQITSAYLQDNRLKEGPYQQETPRIFQRVGDTP